MNLLKHFYRFIEYDAYEQRCRSQNASQERWSQNINFPEIFRVIVKKPVLLFFQSIVSGKFIHQTYTNSNNSQFFTVRICGKNFSFVAYVVSE